MVWVILSVIIAWALISLLIYFSYRETQERITTTYSELKNNTSVRLAQLEDKLTESTKNLKSSVKELDLSKVTNQLFTTNNEMSHIKDVIHSLNSLLTNSKKRGDLGEKLAEDIIAKLGFVENIQYFKHLKQPNGKIPDFTFMLANKFKVNMDSKFALDNYLKYLKADSEHEKKQAAKEFVKDVKSQIKEVASKDYIDPANGTTDFAIIFLGSESILSFILEFDDSVVDYAFENKVILCTPITLYMVLRVFYQVNYMYNLDKNVLKAVKAIQGFRKELEKYLEEQQKFDDKMDAVLKVRNGLNTTRYNQLEKTLEDIDKLFGPEET